jgi:hypothetical protein
MTRRGRAVPVLESIDDVLSDDEPKPLTATRWAVPTTIELGASSTLLGWYWDGAPERWVKPGPTMLERFIGLRDASADRIVAYAREWGVLGICEHGVPSSHNQTQDLDIGGVLLGCEGLGELAGEHWVFREPIAAWHHFAGEAAEAALLAAALRGYGRTREPSLHRRLGMTLDLQSRLNRWLELGAVKPTIVLHPDWMAGDPEAALLPTIGASGLFGALALQLALAGSGIVGLAPCAGCGEWFTPNFAPREGQRAWCPQPHCKKAKVAAASRAYRERTTTKQRLLH